jgi:hypothetical protein
MKKNTFILRKKVFVSKQGQLLLLKGFILNKSKRFTEYLQTSSL